MIARISFTIIKPKNENDLHFIEWIKYNCGMIDEISDENKMKSYDMEDFIKQKNIKYKVLQRRRRNVITNKNI
jgi:hypothetical protein